MTKNLARLIKYLETQMAILDELDKKAFQKPSPDAIHRLRVAGRRARAALWLLKRGGESEPPLRAANRDLRRLGKALGSVRELDVAIRGAKKYGLDTRCLKSERKKCRKKVHDLLHDRKREKLYCEIAASIEKARAQNQADLRQAMGQLRGRLACWQRRRPRGSKELHQLRISVKKMRYSLEALQKPVQSLEKLQGALGRAHDLEVLKGFFKKNQEIAQEQKRLNKRAAQLAETTLKYRRRTP